MSRAGAAGEVWVDAAALQSPTSRGRGIARYAEQWALALERARPDLVGRYLLDPALAPPTVGEELLATGKLAYADPEDPATRRVRHIHTLSPFDLAVGLETVAPGWAARAGATFSATVYDLIPARDPEGELADPLVRRRYRTRLELVRGADQLHAISRHVATELHALLGVRADRLVHAGAAPAPHFSPDRSGEALEPAAALLGGLERPFVLAPGGSHPRKNNERLIEAFALLPEELRRAHRLVITGSLPPLTVNHYRHLAETGDFAESLVVTGEISDELLLSCYRAAELVCFPSLAEGYGLPVAEAIACGTPVIAADRPPLDELLGPLARFDPRRAETIALALGAALGDPEVRARIAGAARPLGSYARAAAASAAGFERLLAGEPRALGAPLAAGGGRRHGPARLRLAVVSPFPPAPSGVAAYSYRLVEELLATGAAAVDAYCDGPTPDQTPPEGATRRAAGALGVAERLLGRYDAVIYALGNSHHHLGALAELRQRPGIVIAHDVRLANCYRHENGDPAFTPRGFVRAVAATYPEPGLGISVTSEVDELELARTGPLFAREAIAAAEVFFVSSPPAAALATVDAHPRDVDKIAVLPFAIEDPATHRALFAAADSHGVPAGLVGDPLICHFGIVDPVKLPGVLVEAVARLRAEYPRLRCGFVGPIAAELAAELAAQASALGCADAVVMTGALDPATYRAALGAATVAVQLRAQFNGEASAAVGECLAAGVPTVVSRLGWARDLPPDAVMAIDSPVDAGRLAAALDELLRDVARRAALSTAGRREADRRSFARTAAALLEVVRNRSVATSAR